MLDWALNTALAGIGRKKSLTLFLKRQEKFCYCIQRRI